MKKRSILLIFSLFLTVLASCSGKNIQLREVVYAMVDAADTPMSGSVYTTDSSGGSPDFLSPELLGELFGGGFDFSGTRGSVYLSGGVSLFEIAVFDCPDPDTAEALGGICAIRFAEAARTAKKLGLAETESTVKIYGNCVLAAMCSGSESVIGAGLEKIKG